MIHEYLTCDHCGEDSRVAKHMFLSFAGSLIGSKREFCSGKCALAYLDAMDEKEPGISELIYPGRRSKIESGHHIHFGIPL